MVLIFSSNSDNSTLVVSEWLDYKKISWIRINGEDKIRIEFLGNDIRFFLPNNFSFLLSEIKSFWYRRGVFNIDKIFISEIKQFASFQHIELKKIFEYVFFKLNELNKINSFENSDVNKLIVSVIATELGLETPNDYLFSKKECFKKIFENTQNELITKSISGDGIQDFKEFAIYNYSKKITSENVKSNQFFPSLVQSYVDKKYELRIFYLNERIYSMAILSQADKKTQVDFRNYNKEKPNRTVPFKLPKIIAEKLKKLMKRLHLNSGSIDMIVTPNNQFVFLEVNPIGQFGMTSYPCNYNIESIIADTLKYE